MGCFVILIFIAPLFLAISMFPDDGVAGGIAYIVILAFEILSLFLIAPKDGSASDVSTGSSKKSSRGNPMLPHRYRKSIRRMFK